MKFLGIHLGGHDSNFTYTDGVKVRYFKSERFKQIKHHVYLEISEFLNTNRTHEPSPRCGIPASQTGDVLAWQIHGA